MQKNLIHKTSQQLKCLTGHGQDHNSIEILKAYDIQGVLNYILIFYVTNCIFHRS